jgi:L-iditol 2-dehydrogenase
MIGLLVIQALRAAGCGQIFAVDLNEDRLALARTLGADVGLCSAGGDIVAEVLDRTSGQGADLAFEVVGLSPTLNLALDVLRKGASLVMVGNLASKVEFPLQAAVTREITLYGSCASRGEYPACLDMIARGAIDVKALISATAPLSEGASWFKRLYEREPGLMKVILNP